MGHPPTGRRFADVDEIYIFHVRGGKLAAAFGVEDNMERMRSSASPRERSPAAGRGIVIRARDPRLPGLLVPPRRTAVRVHHRVAIRHRRAATAGAP